MADNEPEFPSVASMTGQSVASYISPGMTTWKTSATSWGDSSDSTVNYHIVYDTPHASGNFDYDTKAKQNSISAYLCFKYIKSKLNLIESTKFKSRMMKLEKMIDEFTDIGQIAMAEECLRFFIIATKESAMWACGYKYWITKDHAEKFRYSLKGNQSLRITNLENFGRLIPKKTILKLKQCNTKKLFDSYVIFHLDSKGSHIETEKQKIERERDPILFGTIKEAPDRYYFIDDWIDEIDDLQFSDILDALDMEKKEHQIEPSVSMEDVKKILKPKK